jgi:hypothetical protein
MRWDMHSRAKLASTSIWVGKRVDYNAGLNDAKEVGISTRSMRYIG